MENFSGRSMIWIIFSTKPVGAPAIAYQFLLAAWNTFPIPGGNSSKVLFVGKSGSETALVPWVVNVCSFSSPFQVQCSAFSSVILQVLLMFCSLLSVCKAIHRAVTQSCTWRKNGVIYFCTQGSWLEICPWRRSAILLVGSALTRNGKVCRAPSVASGFMLLESF